MGKKGEVKETKEAEQPAKAKVEKKQPNGSDSNTKSPEKRLEEVRSSRRRPAGALLLVLFLAGCAWLIRFSDPCGVKKRKDCGWSGITEMTCRAGASFLVADKWDQITMKIERKEKKHLGLEVRSGPEGKWSLVTQITEGAVELYNRKAGLGQELRIGDRIIKIGGSRGDKVAKELKKTSSEPITINIERAPNHTFAAKLPAALVKTVGHHTVGVVLQGSAFEKFLKTFSWTAGAGVFLWLLSGYPSASLPLYYFAPSAFVAWWHSGCCYNDKVSTSGDPHCFCSADDDTQAFVTKAYTRTTKKRIKSYLGLK